MIVDLTFQLLQMTLVIAVAPLLTGIVRATKARRRSSMASHWRTAFVSNSTKFAP